MRLSCPCRCVYVRASVVRAHAHVCLWTLLNSRSHMVAMYGACKMGMNGIRYQLVGRRLKGAAPLLQEVTTLLLPMPAKNPCHSENPTSSGRPTAAQDNARPNTTRFMPTDVGLHGACDVKAVRVCGSGGVGSPGTAWV